MRFIQYLTENNDKENVLKNINQLMTKHINYLSDNADISEDDNPFLIDFAIDEVAQLIHNLDYNGFKELEPVWFDMMLQDFEELKQIKSVSAIIEELKTFQEHWFKNINYWIT